MVLPKSVLRNGRPRLVGQAHLRELRAELVQSRSVRAVLRLGFTVMTEVP